MTVSHCDIFKLHPTTEITLIYEGVYEIIWGLMISLIMPLTTASIKYHDFTSTFCSCKHCEEEHKQLSKL